MYFLCASFESNLCLDILFIFLFFLVSHSCSSYSSLHIPTLSILPSYSCFSYASFFLFFSSHSCSSYSFLFLFHSSHSPFFLSLSSYFSFPHSCSSFPFFMFLFLLFLSSYSCFFCFSFSHFFSLPIAYHLILVSLISQWFSYKYISYPRSGLACSQVFTFLLLRINCLSVLFATISYSSFLSSTSTSSHLCQEIAITKLKQEETILNYVR